MKDAPLPSMYAQLNPEESLEVGLMGALRNSSRWFVDNAEAAQLAAGCMSEMCREFGKPRQPDAPLPGSARTEY